jgi:dihydrofolate reductase
MRKVTAVESITLDGVMQAPGGADEDTRGGFTYGGWATAYPDDVMFAEMSKGFGTGDLLFGRRTYEQFYSYWPHQDGPFTDVLNETTKYVASRTGAEPLPWQNSVSLPGDAARTVAELKRQPGGDLGVLGSGDLLRTLRRADLVDEYVLLIHPLTLGSGSRLFDDDTFTTLRLIDSMPTTTGVIIARYERTTR